MMLPVIQVFTENNDYQYIETLRRNRTKRHQAGEFFVEGVRSINQAIKNEWEIKALIYTRQKRLSDWATDVIATSKARRHYELSSELMEKISDKEDASELIALVGMPVDDLARIPISEDFLAVVLDRLVSPGNLGTILRTCDALGVKGVIVSGHAADLYAPETIRAAAGSFFAIPAVRLQSHNDLLPWLSEVKAILPGLQICGTSSAASVRVQDQDFTHPLLLLIGNETHGLSNNYKALSDSVVKIPMFGSASSLNVSCAASIILYEISRQRVYAQARQG